ncbi:hypothetical protein KFL_004610090 [Klebsormidium nitens]|uniref:SOUL heme-binding family protein n=1 Tax=Klebsormidium nitens TaxID=105231 RepID=A0A1Y1ICY1_KLENI|nr:hypothetical protein KFL_004610090 [Klebsormidium nitens]|eukprot:GAQ88814.1 hypothetical protein KFL_004610090 [Klebsormidium nitens]
MAGASLCSSPPVHLPGRHSVAGSLLGPKDFEGQILHRKIVLGGRQHRLRRVSAYLADSVTESVTDVLRRVGVDPTERRLSLVLAIGAQAGRRTEDVVTEAAKEASKYVNPRRSGDARNLEEALMATPDLETIPYRVLKRTDDYEIRDVESYFVAETEMGSRPFDFAGAGPSFNTLADYLFGNNSARAGMEMTTPVVQRRGEAMEMTTPVITRQGSARGEAMDMTTPVVTSQGGPGAEGWRMSFVLPRKNVSKGIPQPVNGAVRIREVPARTVAVVAFSGYVSDQQVEQRERKLRNVLAREPEYRVIPGATPEVAQFNPPFTLPFLRRNEVALEVERTAL